MQLCRRGCRGRCRRRDAVIAVVGVAPCREICQRTLGVHLVDERRRRVDEDVGEDHVDEDLGDEVSTMVLQRHVDYDASLEGVPVAMKYRCHVV